MTFERFSPPRRLEEYVGHAGIESGGLALPPFAFEALAAAKTTDTPCELVVTGMTRRPDGSAYLSFGATREHIEATTNHRLTPSGFLWTCPDCGLRSGRHSKTCAA